jgi:aspartate/methionine/tyrosine aminotransferase
MSIVNSLSPRAISAPESGIVEVLNYARGREGLLPLWVGEGDLPSPDFVNDAAMAALAAGETFYTYQRGIPELRQALSDYYARHFGITLPAEHFFVTGSGMQAIQIAVQAMTSPGDELVYLTPAWPNIAAALEIAGARSVGVQLAFDGGKWAIDLDRIAAAITPKTRALFINTPSNPTGWTATRQDLAAILGLARKHGLWIMADEIYARYYFPAAAHLPSWM